MKRLATIALTAAAIAAAAGPASASTTLGQIDPTPQPKFGCPATGCLEMQLVTTPGTPSYVVPFEGVITAWQFRAGAAPGTARLQIYAPGPGAGNWTLAAETPDRVFALGEIGSTLTQIPVKAGEHLGVASPGTPAGAPGDTPTTKSAGGLVTVVASAMESIRTGYLTVAAMSVGQVTVSATGTVGAHALRSATGSLAAGNRVTLRLKIPRRSLIALKRKLAKHRKVTAKLVVSSRSANGATSSTSLRIRLAR